jgi:hypothetical protein
MGEQLVAVVSEWDGKLHGFFIAKDQTLDAIKQEAYERFHQQVGNDPWVVLIANVMYYEKFYPAFQPVGYVSIDARFTYKA